MGKQAEVIILSLADAHVTSYVGHQRR